MKLLRYPGAKSKKAAQDQIRLLFPEKYSELRDCFVGGGSILRTIPQNIPLWINDLNRPLIAVYEALKGRPKAFAELCQSIASVGDDEIMVANVSGKTLYPKRLIDKFQELLNDDDGDPALRYLFCNRMAWNGRVRLDPRWRHRTYFSNPKGWNNVASLIADAAEIVERATITCSDFEWLFDEPGDDPLIFCDPPYVLDTELGGSAKLYDCGFTLDDHRRLQDCVRRCHYKVLLTYDDHAMIRELYKDLFIHEASWTYTGRADRRKGRELIITNYPPCVSIPQRSCDEDGNGDDAAVLQWGQQTRFDCRKAA